VICVKVQGRLHPFEPSSELSVAVGTPVLGSVYLFHLAIWQICVMEWKQLSRRMVLDIQPVVISALEKK
jgi:hypothetical protein